MQDLIAGHIDMVVDNPANCLPHIRSGAIKAYAVTAKNRLSAAPSIPTVDEAGVPGLYFFNWKALWVRAGTPSAIVAKLNSTAAGALGDPMLRERLDELGQEIFRCGENEPGISAFWRAWEEAANTRADRR
jgi:tripartite-type tricarboxylate transporter receptor subunit TctC